MDQVQLNESVSGATALSNGRYHAKLIAADTWGSTAYYSSEVLQRDGSRVFHSGLKMFRDHLTESEAYDRPEGSIDRLVGKLISDAQFEADGEDGPGLYADVEFYPSFIERISEIKEDVGLSIRADGLTEAGERDGRYGPILAAMLKAQSVDVVTQAGAGGKLTRILESDRGLAGRPIETKENQSMTDVTKEDFEALSTKIAELPTLFVSAIKDANLFGQAPEGAATEGAGAVEAEAATESTVTDTTTSTVEAHDEAPVVVEIDHAAIVEALRTNELPAEASAAIVADVTSGKSIADAVAKQVKLREAFLSTAPEHGAVHLRESAGATGLQYAVATLKH